MTTVRLCVECRHCTISKPQRESAELAMCLKGERSPVDGSVVESCREMRQLSGVWSGMGRQLPYYSGNTCGPDGDWWEPRVKPSAGMP